jgi:hypothetical protein
MAMKFLPFDDQLVAHFPSDHEQDDLVFLDIIQHAEIACAEFELSQRIRPQFLDRPSRRRWIVSQPRLNRRFEDALLPHQQRPQLGLGVLSYRDLERH